MSSLLRKEIYQMSLALPMLAGILCLQGSAMSNWKSRCWLGLRGCPLCASRFQAPILLTLNLATSLNLSIQSQHSSESVTTDRQPHLQTQTRCLRALLSFQDRGERQACSCIRGLSLFVGEIRWRWTGLVCKAQAAWAVESKRSHRGFARGSQRQRRP